MVNKRKARTPHKPRTKTPMSEAKRPTLPPPPRDAEQQLAEVQGRFDAAVLSHEILERERNEAQRQLAEVRGKR